jgi:hypothetical protein
MTSFRGWVLLLAGMTIAAPAAAQDRQTSYPDGTYPQQESTPVPTVTPVAPTGPGEVARSSVGQVGQRQSRDDVTREAGLAPMGRVNARIANRVQSRIRNRIDRFYSPQANAASPFAVAGEQARARRSR